MSRFENLIKMKEISKHKKRKQNFQHYDSKMNHEKEIEAGLEILKCRGKI